MAVQSFFLISATQGIGPIYVVIQYQLYENECQLIADTQAKLSALELGQKVLWQFKVLQTKIVLKYVFKKF